MSVTLKQIEAFVHVADLGAFNKAADRLSTTQPNISSRIASLESLLGVSLMDRDAGSVRLTPEGTKLLGHARQVLTAVEEMQMAAGDTALIHDTLRLGVTEMVAYTWLREFLKEIKLCFPNIGVELSVDASTNIERALTSRSIDLALHNAPFERAVSAEIDLGSWPLCWVAAANLELPKAEKISAGELKDHTIILHSPQTQLREEIAAHFRSADHPAQGLVSANHLSVCLRMAQEGFGVAAIPYAMAFEGLESGTLINVPYAWRPSPLRFKARYESERAPAFIPKIAEIAAETTKAYISTRA